MDLLRGRARLEAPGLDLGCSVHDMPLDQCPCPRGDGAWLRYRALWIAARREVAKLEQARAAPARWWVDDAITTLTIDMLARWISHEDAGPTSGQTRADARNAAESVLRGLSHMRR